MSDEQTSPDPKITPESAKALADEVLETAVIPKKIPPADDVEEQTKAIGGALASALLTATEIPLHTLQPVVADLASQLVALGVRQTDHVDPSALHAPAWITDGIRQQSVKIPEQPDHTAENPAVERTATAPPIPARIPKAARAVRR